MLQKKMAATEWKCTNSNFLFKYILVTVEVQLVTAIFQPYLFTATSPTFWFSRAHDV